MERLITLETQVHRIVADIESEKGTRSRSNASLDERLRSVEQKIWAIGGGLAVLNIILKFL